MVILYGAGRTDAGVHALGQVAHFDLHKSLPTRTIVDAINHFLRPHPIMVLAAAQVDRSFHARFSAISRSYFYRILNRYAPPALDVNRVWHVREKLDAVKMHEAAQILVGKHDFSSFRSSHCQAKTPLRSIHQISVIRTGDGKHDDTIKNHIKMYDDEVIIHVKARSFLHNQVRIIAGNLRKIGGGQWDAEQLTRVLRAKDRRAADATAPAYGLYLHEIKYVT